MKAIMLDFKAFYGMPLVYKAVDYTHVYISKRAHFPDDYYYFKTRGYPMVAQAVFDAKKMFQSIFINLPGLINDQRVL